MGRYLPQSESETVQQSLKVTKKQCQEKPWGTTALLDSLKDTTYCKHEGERMQP